MANKTLVRITTIPIALEKLLSGQLSYMNNHYKVVAVAAQKENLEKLGESQGIEVFHLEMTRKITPFKDLLAVIKLFLYFKKTKPFIVHTHTPKAGTVGMLASKLAGVPNRLHTVAGLPLLEAKGKKRKLLDFDEKLTYSCATKVYPNSFGLSYIIVQNKYCSSKKLKVLANGSTNGIDTTFFDPLLFNSDNKDNLKKELGINQNDLVFVFVGRLVADKGINELIEAFEALQQENKTVKLLLVGYFEDDLDPLLPATLESIKSNKGIIHSGFKQDVRPYFSIADVLVFPSYREGFPNVVMQAGAMELACIVTDINGCNEIIVEGKNGLIIPVKNKQAILESMKSCIENESKRVAMQKNARQMIVSRYEQKVVWEAILSEYNSFNY